MSCANPSSLPDYGWFYDIECPPDRSAVEYHRIKTFCTNRYAYRVRYNRMVVSSAKLSDDEFIRTECVVPSSNTPHIIEIAEPDTPIRPDKLNVNTSVFGVGSIIAGIVCYGILTC
jgi:hypothetical protein